jgi:hypothetical protein
VKSVPHWRSKLKQPCIRYSALHAWHDTKIRYRLDFCHFFSVGLGYSANLYMFEFGWSLVHSAACHSPKCR